MNVLITGTSKGIGLHLTLEALRKGYRVIAISRNTTKLSKFKNEHPHHINLIEADITQEVGREKILKELNKLNLSSLDILINNAGVLIESTDEKSFMDSFQLNSVAPFLLTQALLPFLKQNTTSKIIQISSIMGSIQENSSGGYYSYRASKAALNMITKSLSLNYPSITFQIIHPGWVKTDMGGPGALIEPSESALGIWNQIEKLKPGTSLQFIDYKGSHLPW